MFFTFDQNNSGGSFEFDGKAGISHYVIIEADSSGQANDKAERIGLYFNGCENERDCDCCGDRWSSAYGDGRAVPSVYSEEILVDSKFPTKEEGGYPINWMKDSGAEGFIHYANGSIKSFWV